MAPDTDYGIVKSTGQIKQIGPTDNKPDRLFALNDDGTKNTSVNAITVNDKKLLPSLTKDNFSVKTLWGVKTGASAVTKSKTDAFNVFHFMSTNSNVELGLQVHKNSKYLIANNHSPNTVGSVTAATANGLNSETLISDYHTHPNKNYTETDDRASGMIGDQGHASGIINDRTMNHNIPYTTENMPKFYIFRPNVKQPYMFEYSPWTQKKNPRNVNSGNDLKR
nr:JAB-like toxin 1 domain-containing protein [Flavobacterium sp. 316]